MKKGLLSLVALLAFGFSVNVYAADISELSDLIKSGEKTIVLEDDYEGNPTGIRNDVTIDLNGHKINAVLGVMSKVTLKDSKGTGELTSSLDNGATVQVIGGEFTLDGATITNPVGYGIAGYDGGVITIKDGKISSMNSAISGNNTEGTLTVTVNGGELIAKEGPAIYMSSPVGCTITGGTLTGGLSVRMGVINISGGKFIANPVVNDIKTDYTEQNIAVGDALFVLGGTYTTEAIEGNKLELNITGGEFINENKTGSAIAIYDLGKVEQNVTINVSGNVKATTNASNRTGFDVLSLSEAGITNPEEGYGVYSGKVSAVITGGTFTGDVSKYIANGYASNLNNGVSTVAKREIKVVLPVVSKDNVISVAGDVKDTLDKSLENSKIDTKNDNPTIEVSVKALDAKEVSEDVLAKISDYVKMSSKKLTVANYFDISLLVKNANNEEIGTLSEVTAPIEFKMVLTDDLKNVKTGYARNYFVLRIHDDKTEIIPAKVDNGSLVFSSDKFSNYVLAYEDVADVKNPATLDDSASYIYTGALSLITLMGAGYLIKKRCK
ncbi:MAG: hypothetical protein Q4C33_03495 [bacterium]|nr:hypothetical protein [bacterium]